MSVPPVLAGSLAQVTKTDVAALPDPEATLYSVLHTYSRFQDEASQQAAELALIHLVQALPAALATARVFVGALVGPKTDIALLALVVLLLWANRLLEAAPRDQLKDTVAVWAQAVAGAAATRSDSSRRHVRRINAGALRAAQRAAASMLTPDNVAVVVEGLVLTPANAGLFGFGIVCAAASLLVAAPGVLAAYSEVSATKLREFFVANAVLAKAAPSAAVWPVFGVQISHTWTTETWDALLPDLEKGCLRAPEVVIAQVTAPVVALLCPVTLLPKLLDHLVSALKLLKAETRSGAEKTLSLQAARGGIDFKKVTAALKSVSATEIRAGFGNVLAAVADSTVVPEIAAVAAKEVHELSLTAFVRALLRHASAENDITVKAAATGIASPKEVVRRVWVLEIASARLAAADLAPFVQALAAPLTKAYAQVVAAPNPSVANRTAAIAYAVMAMNLDLAAEPTLAVLQVLWPKLGDDAVWLSRAARTVIATEHASPEYANLLVYLLGYPASKKDTLVWMCQEYAAYPGLGSLLVDSAIAALEAGSCKATVAAASNVLHVVAAASEAGPLADAIVLAHYPGVCKQGYAHVCLEAGVDAGVLVASEALRVFDRINATLGAPLSLAVLVSAALSALATAAFMGSDKVGEKVLQTVLSRLIVDEPLAQDVAIFHASGDTPVVDVLSAVRTSDKNTKDYATKKWEEEVRGRKLTPAELKLVKNQLEAESSIRASVTASVALVGSALAMIEALAAMGAAVPVGAGVWLPNVYPAVLGLGVSHPNLVLIVGLAAGSAVVALFGMADPRLGAVKPAAGGAAARISQLPLDSQWTEEPLEETTLRVLFRARMVGDGLGEVLMNLLLPVLEHALASSDAEQQMLAAECMAANAECFATISAATSIPLLLRILAASPHAVRDALAGVGSYAPREQLQPVLDAVLSAQALVRTEVLNVLDTSVELPPEFVPELWLARFDPENEEVSESIWEQLDDPAPEASWMQTLLPFLGAPDDGVRRFIARGVAAAIVATDVSAGVAALIAMFVEYAKPPPPVLDQFGTETRVGADRWEQRLGVALALEQVAATTELSEQDTSSIFRFLLDVGVADNNSTVRRELVASGTAVLDLAQGKHSGTVVPLLQAAIDRRLTPKELVLAIVLYAACGRYMDPQDLRLQTLGDRLVELASTPSELVQRAVGDALATLMPVLGKQAYLETLLQQVFTKGSSLVVRRGAALAAAGVVKGCGIAAMARHDVVAQISDAVESADAEVRELAALLMLSLLSALGAVFEPYWLLLVPVVVMLLGDLSTPVRTAAERAANAGMEHTTSFGVTRVIPLAIELLSLLAWRSQKGAVDLLGRTAYLAPAQLLALLATVVPEIVLVRSHLHKEVRKAAAAALETFTEVIRNPEIKALTPQLLEAIAQPSSATEPALDALIATKFVHYIDGPLLALLVHVLHRASTLSLLRRKLSQIVGNMAVLVAPADLEPYLADLVLELELAMLDLVAHTRATAARALGLLVERLGELRFPDLIPRLFAALDTPGDRMGAAQALAEVTAGLGIGKLEEVLPRVVKAAVDGPLLARAGAMPMLLFLPACFGAQFAPYLSQVVPAVLAGLADNGADVRDVALRAGRALVNRYSSHAVELLLPALEEGMGLPDPRIRLLSVELAGDLLLQVGDTNSTSEMGRVSAAIGTDRLNKVLAHLFITRTDPVSLVRAAAGEVWKPLVLNLPRTIRDILPTLTPIVVRKLASRDELQQELAAAALADLGERAGRAALEQLLPTLTETLNDPDADVRRGICVAAARLVLPETVRVHRDTFVLLVRRALGDDDSAVRAAAVDTFDELQEHTDMVQVVVPDMLADLSLKDSVLALVALTAAKPTAVFPAVAGPLIAAPSIVLLNALAQVVPVSGDALVRWIGPISAVLVDCAGSKNAEVAAAATSCLAQVVASVPLAGVHVLVKTLLEMLDLPNASTRALGYTTVERFVASTHLDYSDYTTDILTRSIVSLGDGNADVVAAAHACTTSLVKATPKDALLQLVKAAGAALAQTPTPLTGFDVPRTGPGCILPVFLHGLMYGSADVRAAAAAAVANTVSKTPADKLRAHVTSITGPLIRVVGERVPPEVRHEILHALDTLLGKTPQFLRPFVPQLQRTFVKALGDGDVAVRSRAAAALGTLIQFQPRVDPLIAELVAAAKAAEPGSGVRGSVLEALFQVVLFAGSKMLDTSKSTALALVELFQELDGALPLHAKLVGVLAGLMLANEASAMVLERLELGDPQASPVLNAFVRDAPEHVWPSVPLVVQYFVQQVDEGSASSMLGIAKLMLTVTRKPELVLDDESADALVACVCKTMVLAPAPELRRLALTVVRTVARQVPQLIAPRLDVVAPAVFRCVRDTIIPIRLAAEKAFLLAFHLVESSAQWDQWFATVEAAGSVTAIDGTVIQARSLSEYTRRVAQRLAGVERERIEAGGDREQMFSDEVEDEKELWE